MDQEKACDGRGKWMGETKHYWIKKICGKNETRNNKATDFLLAC